MRESESRFLTRVVSESRLVRTGDDGLAEAAGDAFDKPLADTGIDDEELRLFGVGFASKLLLLLLLVPRQLCDESDRFGLLLLVVMDGGPEIGARVRLLLFRLLVDGGPDGPFTSVFSGGFGATLVFCSGILLGRRRGVSWLSGRLSALSCVDSVLLL